MDAYLEAPLHPGRASWEPLRAVLAVSGLPRGALVELQPLACLADMPQASTLRCQHVCACVASCCRSCCCAGKG